MEATQLALGSRTNLHDNDLKNEAIARVPAGTKILFVTHEAVFPDSEAVSRVGC
jgi:hypothetical protein